MTDNEKAATFIGWREGQPCSHRERIDGSQWGNGIQQCFLCHCRLPIDRCFHTDPAPPMADPRNYMKALENVAQAGKDSDSMEAALTRTIINRDGGEIVAWLAALYDAERAS